MPCSEVGAQGNGGGPVTHGAPPSLVGVHIWLSLKTHKWAQSPGCFLVGPPDISESPLHKGVQSP